MADFFYVWLKRTQGHRRPDWFASYLCDHDQEAVVNVERHRDKGKLSAGEARQKAHEFYQKLMTDIKKTVTVKSGARKQWDEAHFFEDARRRLSAADSGAMKAFYEFANAAKFKITWGKGGILGSFSLVSPRRCSRSFISVYSNGDLAFNFAFLYGTPEAETFCKELKGKVTEKFGSAFAQKGQQPSLPIAEWRPRIEDVKAIAGAFV